MIGMVLLLLAIASMTTAITAAAGDANRQSFMDKLRVTLSQNLEGACQRPNGLEQGEGCWPEDILPPGVCLCKAGLMCDEDTYTCQESGTTGSSDGTPQVGDTCDTNPDNCATGLSCQPGKRQCFHVPRQEAEPCCPHKKTYACAPGLKCKRRRCTNA